MPPVDLTATYRLQLHAGFTCDDACAVVPYLAGLGVSHVYTSPVLAAVPGSAHGYDVLDHTRIDDELGGQEGLERLAAVCRQAGLGLVVDIVPNHMALTAPQWANAPVWQVLAQGRRAPTAHWVDVDWDALGGRFGLPVLGSPLAEVLAAGELVLDTGRPDEGPAAGEPVVRYFDHVFPVAAGTADDGADIAEVLGRQHYLLAHWREAEQVLNYRRFFEVDTLIGVRVEESDVFEQTHRLLLDLNHAGVIDGFRVDHPDGLADPQGYLDQLASSVRPGTPVWVEKILEGDERLPDGWDCAGTTGYDANSALQTALVDPGTTGVVAAAWERAGGEPSLARVVERCKREAVDTLLTPETARLLRLAEAVLQNRYEKAGSTSETATKLGEALRELLVAVDVYRAYVRPGRRTEPDAAARLEAAVERAVARRPEHESSIRALGAVLLEPESGRDPVAGRDLAVRFQQVTGPVMAKGIEDTAFYRWHRLTALNEVGADPAAEPGTGPLRDWAAHQVAHRPLGMTTLSTHDTKRSEDVRARLLAVAGDADGWERCSAAFAAAATEHGVDGPTAHLLWQTILGADGPGTDGPADDRPADDGLELTAERLTAYLTKALRESKEHTTWVDVDEAYEGRVLGLARAALAPGDLRDTVRATARANAGRIRAVTLTQKLLQLTLPGVPDTYQGCELVDLSLVDPDNRRPVDFGQRARRLERLDAGGDPRDLSDEKLLVTAAALRLRRDRPDSFAGGCTLLDAQPEPDGQDPQDEQARQGEALGWLRGDDVAVLGVRGPDAEGRARGSVILPAGTWTDRLTGAVHEIGDRPTPVASLTAELPVALLVRH